MKALSLTANLVTGPRLRLVKPPKRRRYLHSDDNGNPYLTGAPHAVCVPTTDNADRAHLALDPAGLLIPAAMPNGRPNRLVRGAKPRRYPPCCMTAAGVSHDTAAECLAARVARLAREGVHLDPARYQPTPGELLSGLGEDRVRAIIEPRVTIRGVTPEEAALEAEGTRYIRMRESSHNL